MTTEITDVLEQDRYKIGKEIGRGTWGKVYSAKDSFTGDEVAIKVLEPTETAREQMAHRNLDEIKAMQNESRRLAACSHVVPGFLEKDNNDKPFIVMPKYERFLSDVLRDNDGRVCLNKGLDLDQIVYYLSDVAKGLSELHTKLRRAHGDIKPDNIAIDEKGSLLINDLGTSTCASFDKWAEAPRDNMGFVYTRAPECFEQESHPSRQSDIYSFFSFAYRLFTGKYPFEDEINELAKEGVSPSGFFSHLDKTKTNKVLEKKIRNVPRKFRKLMKKCASFYEYSRIEDGEKLVGELEKIVNSMNVWKTIKEESRKWSIRLGIPGALLSLALYASSVHEPTELTMPKVSIQGPLYLTGGDKKEQVEFVRETLYDLPQPEASLLTSGFDQTAKLATDNRNVAYLLKTYHQARLKFGMARNYYTDPQWEMYVAYANPDEKSHPRVPNEFAVVAKSIEVAMTKSKTSDGRVDLEDVCAIARLGEDKVNEARRASGSFNFRDYVQAKDSQGKYIIPKTEQDFLLQWLAQINQ